MILIFNVIFRAFILTFGNFKTDSMDVFIVFYKDKKALKSNREINFPLTNDILKWINHIRIVAMECHVLPITTFFLNFPLFIGAIFPDFPSHLTLYDLYLLAPSANNLHKLYPDQVRQYDLGPISLTLGWYSCKNPPKSMNTSSPSKFIFVPIFY